MRSARTSTVVLAAFVCPLVAACGWNDRTAEIVSALREVTSAKPTWSSKPAVWTDVTQFYTRRNFAPAWIEQDRRAKAEAALHVLQSATDHGLDPTDYSERDVRRLLDAQSRDKGRGDSPDLPRQLAELDARITAALLSLGRDVALGHMRPETIDKTWKGRRKPPDFVGTLEARAGGGDLTSWLEAIRPRHPEYTALQRELAALREEPGEGDSAVDDRILRIRLNLDRWRWMPDDLGSRHLLVNIPSFQLTAREDDGAVLTMKVVVGKRDRRTPVFSAQMSTVVFSPFWNVPDSIAEGETAPAAARDPGFLARNDIEILRVSKSGGIPVDPSTVDWSNAEAVKQLAFRQRPGAKNALGHVKFLFPNSFDVYLHDTPSDRHFARAGRALSHGCVRLEKPEALAQWVLQDAPEWDEARILAAMHAGVEKHVKLPHTIPVHIVYFTAWVDDTGAVHYEPDVYGLDPKQSAN